MKSVLVLMSTYNGEKYLREQIESIYEQIGVTVKLLVRDDGSNDRTIDILEEYHKKRGLIYVKGENINWMHSFWKLVNMANGYDYYAFSDQDDIWDQNKLKRAVAFLEKFEKIPAIYCADQRIVDKNIKVLSHTENKVDITNFTFLDLLVHGNIFRGCTEVWNNSLQEYILSKNIQDIDEPHDAFIMQIALAIGTVVKENAEVMSYRQHEKNVIGSRNGINLILCKIKEYYKYFFTKSTKQKIFSTRCKKIYGIVKNDISDEKKYYYNMVCNYDKTFISSLKLAFHRDCKNQSFRKKIQIIMRKM